MNLVDRIRHAAPRLLFDKGLLGVAVGVWACAAIIARGWVAFLWPGLTIPLALTDAPTGGELLLALGGLLIAAAAAVGLRRFSAHFCPERDSLPVSNEEVANRLGARGPLRWTLVYPVASAVRALGWANPASPAS